MKKTFGSIFVAMLFLALMAGAVFASTAAKEKINFSGTYQSVENDERHPPTIYLHGNGSGDATNLGPFTLHFEGIVHQANGVGTGLEAEHLIMANGDIIFAIGTGLGSASGTPGVNRIVEKFTITGGTGQFENASGEYTEDRLLALATGVSTATIEGTVKLSKDQ
jgi:hypothetical protein